MISRLAHLQAQRNPYIYTKLQPENHKGVQGYSPGKKTCACCDAEVWEVTVGADAAGSTGSLCCETAEEAKTLIPSLQDKISDEDLQELLDEMYKLMPR